MKRIWMLLAVCLLCMYLPALAQEAAVTECSSLLATLPLENGKVQIYATELDGETWLFLPAFADVDAMTLSLDGREAAWEDVKHQGGVWSGRVTRKGETLFDLHVMRSENLRSLYLSSDDPLSQGRDYIESSPDHSTYTTASMALLSPEGHMDHAGDIRKLRGRGNGTWHSSKDKKPYQFRLEEATDLLDIGQPAQTWVLLAESTDRTQLRNRIILDLALELGMEETSHSEHVDLYYDGQYRGTYLLAEKVEIGPSRVKETDYDEALEIWNALAGAKDLDVLPQSEALNRYGLPYHYVDLLIETVEPDAGAYLLELNQSTDKEIGRSWFTLGDNSRFACKNPSNASQGMMEYISTRMEEARLTLEHGGVNPENGRTLEDDFDIDSFVYAVVLNELSCNLDGYSYASSYFVLPAGESRFRAGPVWDFDLSMRYMRDYVDNTKQWKSSGRWGGRSWLTKFYGCEAFVERMKELYPQEIYPVVRDILLGDKEGRYLQSFDAYISAISASVRMNEMLWKVPFDERLRYGETLEEEQELLRRFLSDKSEWMLGRIGEVSSNPEEIELYLWDYYRESKKPFFRIEPFSRAKWVGTPEVSKVSEATETDYAVWSLVGVIEPGQGHKFIQPSVTVNGVPVESEVQADGTLRVTAYYERANYRPVDCYGQDIGWVYNYDDYILNHPEVAEECEYDPEWVMDYFFNYGMYEGHKANRFFDPVEFHRYDGTDWREPLWDAFGEDWYLYYNDYCENPKAATWNQQMKLLVYQPTVHSSIDF